MGTWRDHFETLYRTSEDPWNYETSIYEREKYAETLRCLGGRRYLHGIEIGCSIGVLSADLAPLCQRFTGVDLNERAASRARARLSPLPGTEIVVAEIPGSWPAGRYDLIVLSEVLYFLSEDQIGMLAGKIATDWLHQGDCVVVNWLGDTRTPLSGLEASDAFRRALARHVSFTDRLRGPVSSDYEMRLLRRC
ncbi:methyltransferase domain-containing protein [Rhodobacterales bacterium]|nr:methyltransferase domain-containing protein [Rhodobacterales bacterium]